MAAGQASLDDLKTLYTLEDVMMINETISVSAENERRAHQAANRK